MDELDRSILINLLAEPIDIHLDEISFAVEVAVPNVFHDFTTGNNLRRPKQELLEEGKLFGGQRDYLFVARGAAAVTVKSEVCVAKLCVAAMKAPAHQCSNPRQEFRQNKGLSEIVVCARIQAFNPLLD